MDIQMYIRSKTRKQKGLNTAHSTIRSSCGNVAALIVRIGFWGVPYHNHSILYPPKIPILIIEASILLLKQSQSLQPPR